MVTTITATTSVLAGFVTVTCVSPTTVTFVAAIPPKVTPVVPVN